MNPLFLARMEQLIPDEMDAFLASMEQPLIKGVRISSAKCSPADVHQKLPWLVRPSPFAPNSYYTEESVGLHPYHIEGLLYMQEPSASAAVTVLNPSSADTVLDLCAAPGSKSTQIAEKVKDGFLVANEIDPSRAKILLSNLERMGAENIAVTNMDAPTLCRQLPDYFDKVLVDAPCSGEGMMKKHAAALEGWSMDNIHLCAARQKEIVPYAISALKPGGEMVYSTCTYAPEENEQMVAWILENFPEMEQLDPEVDFGRHGIPTPGMDETRVVRIFPMDGGEGHFIARFRKRDDASAFSGKTAAELKNQKLPKEAAEFLEENGALHYSNCMVNKSKEGSAVSVMNHPFLDFKKGKVLRQGVLLGQLIKNRFEPGHAFYLSAAAADKVIKTELSLDQMDAAMHGEPVSAYAPKGFTALCYDGVPFAYGKSIGSRINNKLPKGLRLNPNSHVRCDFGSERKEEKRIEKTDCQGGLSE